MTEPMKFKNVYAPLRYPAGRAMAEALCARWRVVVYAGPRCQTHAELAAGERPQVWAERDHTGRFEWHEGLPPAPVSVVCDEAWNPIIFETRGGHRLPRLNTPETTDSLDG